MINMKETGKKIKALIAASAYSVEDLKAKLGMSDKSTLYKWFRGDALPSIDNFILLSTILGVTVNDMVVMNKEAA